MTTPQARVTVLGSCGGVPEGGRACAGLLLEVGRSSVVLDLGYGTLGTLLAAVPDVGHLDGIVVSHAHPDHLSDVSGLLRALRYAPPTDARPWLAAPAGVVEILASADPDTWQGRRPVEVLDLPGVHERGHVRLDAVLTPHWVPHTAVRVEVDGLAVVYSADGGADPGLDRLARGADLLVCGVTERVDPDADERGEDAAFLMTGRQAGELAQRSRCGALLLTHFWPGSDRRRTTADATAAAGCPVVPAREGLTLGLRTPGGSA